MKLIKVLISCLIVCYALTCQAWLNVDQMDRYAEKYAGRSIGANEGIQWDNISKFIYNHEDPTGNPTNAGYIDGNDCTHFVSQCLEAGGVPISEDQLTGSSSAYMNFFILSDNMRSYFINQGWSQGYTASWWNWETISPTFQSTNHPYYNNEEYWFDLYAPPEADEICLHFTDLEIEAGYDFLYATDDETTYYYSGENFPSNWWDEEPFSGNAVYFEFDSDETEVRWGYEIDQYKWRTAQTVPYNFSPGDVMILGSESDPDEHAVICTADGPNFSTHSSDRHDSQYNGWYPTYYQRAEFFDMFYTFIEEPDLCWNEYMQIGASIIVTDNPNELYPHQYSDFEYGETVYIFYSFTNDSNIMILDNFQVSIKKNDVELATHQYNGILDGDVFVSTMDREDNVTFTWLNEEVTIEIILDSGNGDDFLAEQNWDEWNESNNSEILLISSTGNISLGPSIMSSLKQNHPNPFNPSTTISYSLADDIIDPQIEIYNVKGQKVKSYQLEDIIGENSIIWNGKDANDKSISSGVYFYRLVNGGETVQSRKMLMIK